MDRLQAQFFPDDPAEILDIWLFKDKESYEQHAQELFGTHADTPYGYYSAEDRALVMNIATGGGTLVHEIVHPLMAANFPACPAWFNEGLGSLYEQSTDVDGKIRGLTNWRLDGLQEAIRQSELPSFQKLCSTTDRRVLRRGPGHELRPGPVSLLLSAGARPAGEVLPPVPRYELQADPTGYQTLKSVLGREDMEAFQKEWEAFVLDSTSDEAERHRSAASTGECPAHERRLIFGR